MNTLVQKPVACAIAAALFLATGTMASAQSSNFHLDLSEGGWVDEVAGLVWGYDYAVISTYCPDDFGFCLSEPLQYTSHPDAEYLAANYREFLATHGFIDDANVAAYWESQGLAWRLPTAEEAANAFQKGLFAGDVYSLYHYSDGFNNFSPFRWTSSGNGQHRHYVLDDTSGAVWLMKNDGPWALPLFVRPLR